MKDNKSCKHEELEKINNKLYICKNCSLFGIIKEITVSEEKIKLLSKPYNYNIKNEINIYDLTKNALNFYLNNIELKINQKKDDISIKNLELFYKYRKKLIKHMFNLCSGVNTTYECYYLSLILIDNIINNLEYIISNYQLDLFSTACFIISKKFIEKDILKHEKLGNQYLTICYSPQKFIQANELINAEVECLKILKYKLNIPTHLTILKNIFICGIIFPNEIEENKIKKIYDICLEILGFCVEQNEIYLNYNPIQVVFGIIYLVRKNYNLKKNISKYFNDLFDIKFSYIKECVKLITNLYYRKYNNNEINNNINKLNNNNNQKNFNVSYNISNINQNNEKKIKNKFSEKSTYFPRKYYFSPIIKSKNVSPNIITIGEFGSATRLSAINLDDIDKINEDNFSSKSIIIIKSENKKINKNFRKYQFFRSSRHRRKENNIDIKNCSYSPNSASTIDVDPIIE